ncbi:MAG: hypothetical protein GXO26_04380 [Crenarchaeota archaeon]|nr:hypothetical protein [Thermoproteota archaeon]
MSLSPASFRRRVAYDVINDYVLPSIDVDRYGLEEREAKAKLLIGFVVALLTKLPTERARMKKAVELCVKMYSRSGIELPEMTENKSVIDWYLEAVEKRQGESKDDWISRIAIASHCILSYACIEEAITPETGTLLY